MITDKSIKEFLSIVDLKNVYYATDADKSLVRLYSACDDKVIQDELIDNMWDYINLKLPSISNNYSGTPIKILHTNGGQGKVIEKCPNNSIITSYHKDYICKQISDLLNQHRTAGANISYQSCVFDIAHYFINGNNGNTPKYDVAIHQVVNSDYHNSLDYSENEEIYYPLRALEFLVKGGYICIYCGNKDLNKIKSNVEISKKTTIDKVLHTTHLASYNCLILKKN